MREILKEIDQYGAKEIYWTVENNSIGEAALVVIRDTGEENFPGNFLHDPIKVQGQRGRKGFHTSNNGYSDINETNYDDDRVKGTSMGNSSQEKDSKNIPKAKSVSRMEKTINLLTLHKNVITDMVEIMKGEMELVQSMENTENRDGLQYASSLESTLDFKDQVLDTLRNELRILRGKII